jgi:SAM-dependent methyltransferase
MTYEGFAYLYDQLMKDVPYDKWVDLIIDKHQKFNLSGKKLLDLGCGTGELSVRMAKAGYHVTGVDLSEDMLTIAQLKTSNEALTIDFLQQNMVELELIDEYDVIGVFCDSINYLETEKDVQQTFRHIMQYLKKDGLFIFDVHSLYKMNEIFMNQTFTLDEEGICYIWNCFEGEYPNSVDHELTFFVEEESGKYERIDENHTQRTYSISTYKKWLDETGFDVVEVIGDFEGEPEPESERIIFVAKKK